MKLEKTDQFSIVQVILHGPPFLSNTSNIFFKVYA